jgi:molecular chaperone DnaJ
LTITRPCGRCRGEGRLIERPCKECGGEGRHRSERRLEIRIPAGVETGSRLRLAGEGDVGPNGGPPGDLYVVLTVEEDERFHREGEDAILLLDLAIAPGTPGGSEIRLRGKGLGRLGRGGRGDLVLRLRVVVPKSPSKEEKELLRRYAELTGAPIGGAKGVIGKAKKIFS